MKKNSQNPNQKYDYKNYKNHSPYPKNKNNQIPNRHIRQIINTLLYTHRELGEPVTYQTIAEYLDYYTTEHNPKTLGNIPFQRIVTTLAAKGCPVFPQPINHTTPAELITNQIIQQHQQNQTPITQQTITSTIEQTITTLKNPNLNPRGLYTQTVQNLIKQNVYQPQGTHNTIKHVTNKNPQLNNNTNTTNNTITVKNKTTKPQTGPYLCTTTFDNTTDQDQPKNKTKTKRKNKRKHKNKTK